jgi:transcription termination factor 2
MSSSPIFKPFEHQLSVQKDLKRMSKNGGGFLCDSMGLGKTASMSMFLINEHQKGQTNLIVCPCSLLSMWNVEIKKVDGWSNKVIDPTILIYHGTARKKELYKLLSYDFVITTYAIIGLTELNNKKFTRVILDESHTIKNGLRSSGPKCAKAAYQIGMNSKVNFCITGTPFNNRINDIASQAKFVGVEPYCNPEWWIDNEDVLCWKNKCVIRRTKDQMISAPIYHDIIIHPTEMEEKLTNILRKQAAKDFENWKNAKNNLDRIELQGKILGLIQKLRIFSNSYYCGQGAIDSDNVINNCAKVDRIITDLDNLIYKDPKKGVVVFSQFTSFLDVLEQIIETSMVGIDIYKFTGSLNTHNRDLILNDFNTSRKPRVILVSLMAGGIGISLHHGSSTVLLSEPYYNPFMEAQAEERVHRLCQTNQVNVYRYQIDNSVEKWVNSLKQQKLMIASGLDLVNRSKISKEFNFNDISKLFNEHVAFLKETNETKETKETNLNTTKKIKVGRRTYTIPKGKKFSKIPRIKK